MLLTRCNWREHLFHVFQVFRNRRNFSQDGRGVVLLELFTGKEAAFGRNKLALFCRQKMLSHADIAAFMNNEDPKLAGLGKWPSEKAHAFLSLACRCVDEESNRRPTMLQVLEELRRLWVASRHTCVICMSDFANALLQCGHACLCGSCASSLVQQGQGCPLCRASVQQITIGNYTRTYVPFLQY